MILTEDDFYLWFIVRVIIFGRCRRCRWARENFLKICQENLCQSKYFAELSLSPCLNWSLVGMTGRRLKVMQPALFVVEYVGEPKTWEKQQKNAQKRRYSRAGFLTSGIFGRKALWMKSWLGFQFHGLKFWDFPPREVESPERKPTQVVFFLCGWHEGPENIRKENTKRSGIHGHTLYTLYTLCCFCGNALWQDYGF